MPGGTGLASENSATASANGVRGWPSFSRSDGPNGIGRHSLALPAPGLRGADGDQSAQRTDGDDQAGGGAEPMGAGEAGRL